MACLRASRSQRQETGRARGDETSTQGGGAFEKETRVVPQHCIEAGWRGKVGDAGKAHSLYTDKKRLKFFNNI